MQPYAQRESICTTRRVSVLKIIKCETRNQLL